MGTDPAGFRQALRAAYIEEPCRVLPNALWKTLDRLEGMDATFERREGRVQHIEMWRPGELHPYWHRDGKPPSLPAERLSSLHFALVHQRYLDLLPLYRFSRREAYFRLSQPLQSLTRLELPPGYFLRQVQMPDEAQAVASLIAACYDDMRPAPDAVRSWTRHPTFASDLWLWAVAPDGELAGLAIAELDATVPEGSLEWIQVLPAHRKRGLGAALVRELLRRMRPRAAFATASGRVDSDAERLYSRCGFGGHDVWWVLQDPC